MDRDAREHYVSLFWRLFVPNATVLAVACAVLWAEPANGRLVALVGGLAMLLAVNWLLMRRAVAPLLRLVEVMERVDPLQPGRRLEVRAPPSEVAILAESFNEMLERLELERRESARRAVSAQQQERRRIARELHDGIGQSLTAHSLHLDRIAAHADPALREELGLAQHDALVLVDDVRSLAQSLRPDVLDNLGLNSALAAMLEHLTARTGLRVGWERARDLPALDDDVELVIYRVAQEAANNVVRHARATRVDVALGAESGVVRLVVADDGIGLPAGQFERSGGGLRWMRERAVAVGARLAVNGAAGGGTRVELQVPVAESPRSAEP